MGMEEDALWRLMTMQVSLHMGWDEDINPPQEADVSGAHSRSSTVEKVLVGFSQNKTILWPYYMSQLQTHVI